MSNNTNRKKTEDKMTAITLLTLFASVVLLISDRFVDGPLSTVLLVAGIVGLLAFLVLVFKTGKIMEEADEERAESFAATGTQQPRFGAMRDDTYNRSTLEDDRQYGSM